MELPIIKLKKDEDLDDRVSWCYAVVNLPEGDDDYYCIQEVYFQKNPDGSTKLVGYCEPDSGASKLSDLKELLRWLPHKMSDLSDYGFQGKTLHRDDFHSEESSSELLEDIQSAQEV